MLNVFVKYMKCNVYEREVTSRDCLRKLSNFRGLNLCKHITSEKAEILKTRNVSVKYMKFIVHEQEVTF